MLKFNRMKAAAIDCWHAMDKTGVWRYYGMINRAPHVPGLITGRNGTTKKGAMISSLIVIIEGPRWVGINHRQIQVPLHVRLMPELHCRVSNSKKKAYGLPSIRPGRIEPFLHRTLLLVDRIPAVYQ